MIYNLLPGEEDANRAAAQANLDDFGCPTADQLTGSDSVLVRDDGEIEPDLLGRRLLVTVALFPQGLDWVAAERKERVDRLLGNLGPGAPTAWQRLLADSEIAQAGASALTLCPTKDEVKSAEMPADAWVPVAQAIMGGRARAEQCLAAELPDLTVN
jgi:hypothetical protein